MGHLFGVTGLRSLLATAAAAPTCYERERPALTFTSSTAVTILCTALLIGSVVQSDAHHASSGWTYPPACCKDQKIGGDCGAIPGANVTRGPHGYSIFIHPGDHHHATRSHKFFVPYGDEIPSGDDDYHICLHPTEDDLNCFFAPPDAV